MTTWSAIEQEIIADATTFATKVKYLAPQNSKYISIDRGKLVDYIYVDNKRVRTNTNRLFESIYMTRQYTKGADMLFQVVSKSGKVPYYHDAVLKKTRTVAQHYMRTEYGSTRYSNSVERQKENKNYLYYMKGVPFLQEFIGKWNGRTIRVSDDIGDFKVW